MEDRIEFIRYSLPFMPTAKLQSMLDDVKIRKEKFQVWCILLAEKLKRNEC